MAAPARFDWKAAVEQDETLKRIDVLMQRTIEKLSGAPKPRVDAGRGSRYEAPPAPVVKTEPVPTSTMPTSSETAASDPSASDEVMHDSSEGTPQFIDYRDYQSESSEIDTREIDPMDYLSDFEENPKPIPGAKQRPARKQPPEPMEQAPAPVQEDQEMGDDDVDMAEEPSQDETEEQGATCEVCHIPGGNDAQTVMCDGCNGAHHFQCLDPPLSSLPEGSWFCPKCAPNHTAQAGGQTEQEAPIKEEAVRTASASPAAGDASTQGSAPVAAGVSAPASGPSGSAPTGDGASNGAGGGKPAGASSIPIVQVLQADAEKSNSLLIHACNCDAVQCADAEFQVMCPLMKRFLRSVCWASHSEKWRSYSLASVTANMFAYHAMHCSAEHCNVPMCDQVREEEIV